MPEASPGWGRGIMKRQVYTGARQMLRDNTRFKVTLQSNRDGREEGSRRWRVEKQGVEKQGAEHQMRQKTEMQKVPHEWWVQPDQGGFCGFVHNRWLGFVQNH